MFGASNKYINSVTIIAIIVVFMLLILNIVQYRIILEAERNLSDMNSKLDAYKMNSLELQERVEKVTNNYASGGGFQKRAFELNENSGVIELQDLFSFDRYHLIYISKNNHKSGFKWETRNKGTVIFNKFNFEFKATTIDSYDSKPYDLNSNSIIMTGMAEVKFDFDIESLGNVFPESKTGDSSEKTEFEVIKYKLEAVDSGIGESNKYDSFELTIMPNSVEAPGLYKTFGESEIITGELYLSEITIQKSER